MTNYKGLASLAPISVSIRSTLLRYSLFLSEYLSNHSNHSTCPAAPRYNQYQAEEAT